MSKPSTVKNSAELQADKPLRQADIDAGKLVLRKRGEGRAAQPHEALKPFEEPERIEGVKLDALKQAACQGWVHVSVGRYTDVADDQLEDFVGQLGHRAARQAKTSS
ncbi:type II toxin-antitoxin system ParD family antitoxin [Rhizobacter sp. OV335]|uniref:type II toxin-antitoxin system ParD family antitoxin n=1 Tax=Rhizobacter sp. OV335 TaxID=1500264 RepID=UPI00090F9EF4|nr:type II toxin-antitoxin system ParD family antitoxin [Rhizobacter sp. OV335]SHM41724.1 antitoxin ParD1/3/4 [Rhizobacter sp. OV335]